ncbi:hypothetical protein [Vibrio penaeicida]|uniref:DUF2541 family protein n=1 Tax=Vibrio penaeicida TaxID=104609 RepID=A0AAV5NRW5_9VIBR|nr:hypothetical protein [Vibrio penaeicida]RTZ24061.1 hypothetical protein EKN09_05650 [Vibrio penaeicida]GLQ73175.1 hypothetical protein GCM10007932_25350 [Vibrio penaeicida]
MKKLLMLLAIMVSEPILAGQIKTNLDVDNVRVRKTVAYVKFSGCSYYSIIYLNSEYEKVMYSSLLAAGMGGKKVTAEFNGVDCSAKELELIYVDVGF